MPPPGPSHTLPAALRPASSTSSPAIVAAPRPAARRTPTTSTRSTRSILVDRGRRLRRRRGRAALLPDQVPARRKGAVAAQIRGNTRLEIGWTVGAAVILVVLAVVTFIKLPDIRTRRRPTSTRRATRVAATTLLRVDRPARAAQGRDAEHRRQRPAVRLALHVPGARATSRSSPTRRWSSRSTRPSRSTSRAEDVAHSWWIPAARRQDRRGPGLHELHLVQDRARAGTLPRPVRRAVRAQPREHDRAGPRRPARRVRGRGSTARRPTSRPRATRAPEQREELDRRRREAAEQSETA